MTAADLLDRLAADGVTLSVTEKQSLRYKGSEAAVSRWLPEVRAHKAELVELLTAPPHPEGIRYATNERLADDRRTCAHCRMLTPAGYCRAAARGELPHAARDLMPDPERLHRCQGYRPDPAEDADQRPGFERWPGLSRSLTQEQAA